MPIFCSYMLRKSWRKSSRGGDIEEVMQFGMPNFTPRISPRIYVLLHGLALEAQFQSVQE